YASAFALHKFGANAQASMVPESVTDAQVAESQAMSRYTTILGMTGTSEGVRVLLENKVGLGVDGISVAPDRVLTDGQPLRMYKSLSKEDVIEKIDRLQEFLRAQAQLNTDGRPGLRRGFIYGL